MMEDKIYRKVLNLQTGNEVLEPLCEEDILEIAEKIRMKNETKEHNTGSERSGTA